MISVILPVYNREETILRAVQCVLQQTEKALECIVVDDASTDGTLEKLHTVSDERLRILSLPRRSGACHARNVGVAAAQGEWIAFQDSDDVFHPDKLEKQLQFLLDKKADVVVCAMNRFSGQSAPMHVPEKMPTEPISRQRLLWDNLASTQCIFGKAAVFRAVPFDEAMPRLQDWALMLEIAGEYTVWGDDAALVDVYVQPDSLSAQPKKLLPALQRLYLHHAAAINALCPAHWVAMLEQAAKTGGQLAWSEDVLAVAPRWVLRPGEVAQLQHVVIGQGGEKAGEKTLLTMNLSELDGMGETKRFLPTALLAEVLRSVPGTVEIAGTQAHTTDERAIAALAGLQNHALAWEAVCQAFGEITATAALAASQHMQMPFWAKLLRTQKLPEPTHRPIRRVAAYYHSICGGGVQRVTAQLLRLWADMGMEVTLITSQAAQKDDEPLPENIRRVVIPPFDPFDPAKRMAHVRALADAAAQVELVVDHAWADPMLLFDVLAIRLSGAKCLLHTHSVFSMTLLKPELHDRCACMPDVAALADGMVALSAVDACYWRQYARRVFQTTNPLTVNPLETAPNRLQGRTMLWAGRNSPEKRPQDAIAAAKWVAERVPGARLVVLGAGFEQEAAQETSPAVKYVGFDRETAPYFAQADLYLCTSEYEGFSLTMAEAQARGIPCVCYDMPYLTILQGGGHVSVPMGDVDALAKAAADLLLDSARRQALGAEARKNVQRLCIDQQEKWTEIFQALEEPEKPTDGDETFRAVLDTLRTHALMQEKAPVAVAETFIPMPERGPCRRLRKKLATLCRVLLIDGVGGVKEVLRQKKNG